jgi:hypothetical protein
LERVDFGHWRVLLGAAHVGIIHAPAPLRAGLRAHRARALDGERLREHRDVDEVAAVLLAREVGLKIRGVNHGHYASAGLARLPVLKQCNEGAIRKCN